MPNGSYKRLQFKLRQVTGVTDVSQQTHFETTRKIVKKMKIKFWSWHIQQMNLTVFISLINVKFI